MPNGQQGQWRPAGVGALAVHVCRIATGEIEETYAPPRKDSGNTSASRKASAAGKLAHWRSLQRDGVKLPRQQQEHAGLKALD